MKRLIQDPIFDPIFFISTMDNAFFSEFLELKSDEEIEGLRLFYEDIEKYELCQLIKIEQEKRCIGR